MSFTDHQVGNFLSTLDKCHLSLHYDNPNLAGAYASELFGGSYERKVCEFTDPSNRGIRSISNVLFMGLPSVTITYLGGWDAKTKGNMLFAIPLETPIRVKEGGTFSIPTNAIVLSFDN